jgi:hypothetical protein
MLFLPSLRARITNPRDRDYMEMLDIGFSIYISVGSVVHTEEIVKGGSIRNKYDGQIAEFTEFGPDFI